MRVSVIIPTYNSSRMVVEAIESVLAQTHPAAEVIVVDDGSTDDTAERLAAFGQRIAYVRQANARVAAARNTGLACATGEAIAFLDADDVWHPQKLERQVAALQEHARIGLLATGLIDWPGIFPELSSGPGSIAAVAFERMLFVNRLATSSVIVRRSVLERAGTFDTELFGPEDYDLWLRCAQEGEVAILEEPLTGYRELPGSVSKQAESMRQGLLRIHAKLGAAGVWERRPWLRQKALANIEYTTGYEFYASGNARRAAALLLRSFCAYPWPVQPPDVNYHFARTRLFLRSALAAIRT